MAKPIQAGVSARIYAAQDAAAAIMELTELLNHLDSAKASVGSEALEWYSACHESGIIAGIGTLAQQIDSKLGEVEDFLKMPEIEKPSDAAQGSSP